jgi:acyl-CoA synthetase (AMP-forming)/AMP-acid ligase II
MCSLFRSAAARPHAVALIAGDETWTYDRLTRYVRRLSQGLLAQGLRPGDRVALHLSNKPETVAALYACMSTGMIAVPLNNRLTRAELEPQLLRLQVSLYLGQISRPCVRVEAVHRVQQTGRGRVLFETQRQKLNRSIVPTLFATSHCSMK